MKKILIAIFSFVLLVTPYFAYAAPEKGYTAPINSAPASAGQSPTYSNPDSSLSAGPGLFSPPATDRSVHYLEEVFGTVGGVIHGTTSSGHLLSAMFRIFNYALLTIACVVLIYSVVNSIVDTANDGEFMGKKSNSVWMVIRAVLGIGILVPYSSGYSLMQVIIMWMTVQGIGLADKVWSVALDHFVEVGSVYEQTLDTSEKNAQEVKGTIETSRNVLAAQVCMYRLQDLAEKDRQKALDQLAQDPSNPTLQWKAKPVLPYHPIWNEDAKTLSFGFTSSFSGSNQACGVYSWKDPNPTIEKYKRAGLQQITLDLAPIAKSIAQTTDQNLPVQQREMITAQAVKSLLGATVDYQYVIFLAKRSVNGSEMEKSYRDNALQDARAKGWLMAGSYYWYLNNMTGSESKKEGNFLPTQIKSIEKNFKDYGIDYANINKSLSYLDAVAGTDELWGKLNVYINNQEKEFESTPFYTKHQQQLQVISTDLLAAALATEIDKGLSNVGDKLKGDGGFDWTNPVDYWRYTPVGYATTKFLDSEKQEVLESVMGVLFSPINAFLGPIDNVQQSWFKYMNTSDGDPIYRVQILGHRMVDSAIELWIRGAVTSLINTFIASVTQDIPLIGGVATVATAGVTLLMPVVNILMGALFISGLTFSVYVPLIPYLIFTFASLGWLISVLEGLVAAPLVAANLTRPEGHDLLGKAEQAVMLILGIFLRPAVMVIGFIAAMVLSRVFIRIINAGFGQFITSGGVDSMGGVGQIFLLLLLMIIYTILTVTVINMVYNAGIVKLWDTIWLWIGHNQHGSGIEKEALGDIKHGAQSGADTINTVGKQADVNSAAGRVGGWAGGKASQGGKWIGSKIADRFKGLQVTTKK